MRDESENVPLMYFSVGRFVVGLDGETWPRGEAQCGYRAPLRCVARASGEDGGYFCGRVHLSRTMKLERILESYKNAQKHA